MKDQKLGAELKQARLDLGLSQRVFAEKMGIPLSTYGRLERGQTQLPLKNAVAVCRAIGCSMEQLIAFLCR